MNQGAYSGFSIFSRTDCPGGRATRFLAVKRPARPLQNYCEK
jgi:hypothetical protein